MRERWSKVERRNVTAALRRVNAEAAELDSAKMRADALEADIYRLAEWETAKCGWVELVMVSGDAAYPGAWLAAEQQRIFGEAAS